MSAQDDNLTEKFAKVLLTIQKYPDQILQAWDEVSRLDFPDDYKSVENVVFCGMGGSALGARIADSFLFDRLRVPFEVFTEYHLPNYANEKTLCIISSYSGSTEETLNCFFEAIEKKTKIFPVTKGGKLAEILTEKKLPAYVFDPINNPSAQPRMAIGYSTSTILALLSKLSLAHINGEEVKESCEFMRQVFFTNDENATEATNLSKKFSHSLKGKIPVLIASEHLVGASHAIKNQFNESAKTMSLSFDIPELNHHLMEGLKNPAKLRDFFTFVFLKSNKYTEKVAKRYPLTSDVVEKNGLEYLTYQLTAETKLAEVFEVLAFGSLCVYFLTKDYQIDPTAIPWVDYFKEKLK